MTAPKPVQVAWMVEFGDGTIELWLCTELDGPPAFGDTVTPLYRLDEDTP